MRIALENRQAVEVRTNPADQHVVAVIKQVVRRDGRRDVGRGFVDELHGIAGGDVFKNHFEGREAFDDTAQVLVDEHFFAIEHVDLAACHFPVYQQQHADFGHCLEGREDLVDAGDTGIELVVAPAGYSLAAWTKPLALAVRMSSGVVWSVR